jgi:signal transduction histidine kinase
VAYESPDEVLISLASLPPTRRQLTLVLFFGVLLFIAFLTVAPFAQTALPEFTAFVPSVSAVMSINDLITSLLLYSQSSIARSKSLLVLASGYLFTALIIIPHALTFPGAFTPAGLLGANQQTAAWLFFAAHFVFPTTLIGYARLKDADRANAPRLSSSKSAIRTSVAVVVGFACVLTLVTTAGNQYLPALLSDRTHAFRGYLIMINSSIIAITIIALVELWTRRRAVLDYWLMLVSVALILEEACFSLSAIRFTLGYYAGRVFWLITSIIVLLLLLEEMARLYARLARSNSLLERERDNKLSNARAITASIAHEVKQPLTAIIASAGAALQYVGKSPPDQAKAQSALDRITREAHRTSDVFDGIRALFERGDQKLEPIDVNGIIGEALESVRGELMDHGIASLPKFASVPLLAGRRNQLQQVVLNLIHNAIEAMQTVTGRKRLLRVTTEKRGQEDIAIVVEDSGPGISPAQLDGIFSAFVTTKTHGMGLGLAICRQIVEHHGGRLAASSDGISGAQFEVVLPIRSADSTNPDGG